MTSLNNYKKVGYLQYDEYHETIELLLNIKKIREGKCFMIMLRFYHGKSYGIEITPDELLQYLNGELSITDMFESFGLVQARNNFFNEDLCQDYSKIEWLANILK